MASKYLSRKLLSGVVTAVLLYGTASFAGTPRGGLRYSVIVDKFENKSENPRLLGDEWATLLTSALYESGQFIVVAQDDMQLQALKEQLRGASGMTAQGRKTAVRGRMTPAQLLVKGVITHFQQGSANQGGGLGVGGFRFKGGRQSTEIRATLQMIDATTGALVAAKNFSAIAQDRAFSVERQDGNNTGNVNIGADNNVHEVLEKAISEVIPWMVSQLPSVPWRGSVVKVDGKRVIINRGSREGVASGDEFVVGESEILKDPDTGETLDEILRERARVRVVQVSERTSICSVVSGDVGQIVEGMGIQHGREKD